MSDTSFGEGLSQDEADGMSEWAVKGDGDEAGNHLIIPFARSLNPPEFAKCLCHTAD